MSLEDKRWLTPSANRSPGPSQVVVVATRPRKQHRVMARADTERRPPEARLVHTWSQEGGGSHPRACDLFHEDAQSSQQSGRPWWRIQLFVWEPLLFGTWDGVFTTCMINIFGVVLFLRTGYLVGNTGVPLGMLLVSLVVLVALVTVMSGVGVSGHCGVGGGGIYSMISTVLGSRVGGTVGLLYVFGQCVAGAMYITGFSESVAEVLGLQGRWGVRGLSAAVLLALLAINLAGVKWIVRLQLLLLAVLAVSTLDFVVGTFMHLDPDHGFLGYSPGLLASNSLQDYSPGETFFTVFGVFFPAATGVMAGFNMSSDLQRPEHNIPVGTLAAVFTSWFLYLVFVFLLGATCTRETLRYDFLIAEKVSLVGFLFLLGLYVSSLASCMGGLYGAPRILQCIAQERVVPALAFLGRGRGPNRTPVAAIILTSLLTLAFIFIGQVNVLAPIVSINFMLTYSFIDYSYFSVAMTSKLQTKDEKDAPARAKVNPAGSRRQSCRPLMELPLQGYGSRDHNLNGTLLEFAEDMDQIFPPASQKASPMQETHIKASVSPKQKLMDSFRLDHNINTFSQENRDELSSSHMEAVVHCGDERSPHRSGSAAEEHESKPSEFCTAAKSTASLESKIEFHNFEAATAQESLFTKFCNHWVALIGAVTSIVIMFIIQWVYAVANIIVALLLFLYIGKTSPGLPLGVAARFSFLKWLKSTLNSICRSNSMPRDEMVITPWLCAVGLKTKQLTEENSDFASRHRHHQSSFITADQMVQPPLR